MYDNNPRSQAFRRPVAVEGERVAMPSKTAAAMPAAEAELLGVIERALERQRASRDAEAPPPLVSRIETILGKRLEAANDAAAAAIDPSSVVPSEVTCATEATATPNVATLPTEHSAPKSQRLKPLAIVALISALGAASGALIPAETARYSADAVFAVQGDGEGRAAVAKAAEKTLRSSHAIAATVAALKLDRDPEFFGLSSDAFAVAVDLLSTDGAAADPLSHAEASLVSAIRTTSDPHAGTIDFKVTTGSAEKSARIANYLASVVTGSGTTKAAVEDGSLKKAADAAQLDLTAFTQKSGEGNVKVAIDLQRQIGSMDAELKAGDERIAAAQERARRLKAARVGDVIAGTLDADLMSPTLVDRRDKYVAAQLSLSQLSANLGPRHPRLQAQQAEVDGLKAAIGDDIARLLRETTDEMKQATVEKRQLSDSRNALIAQSKDTGVDLAKLAELRDKASAARQRLEDAITTGAVTPGAGSLRLQKAVQVAAVPAEEGWLPTLLGAFAGLAFGLATVSFKARARFTASARKEPSLPTPAPKPVVVAPSAAEPAAMPQEVDIIRAELAAMRDRLRTRQAAS